ncbi:MAG TPA: PilN domain-containing protein [Burkholderiales bacterium]|nr:PilN domain-containing protein [Pseudomonadota bacterium]HVC50059.1 PilN domain-containing protein [Burkholderiales bacterium]
MMRINLLPHRELKRAARRRQFSLITAATAGAAVILIALIHVWLVSRLHTQVERNNYLEQINNQLDQQIAQIQKLKIERTKVLARKKIIEALEEKRSRVVHMLDEIPRLIPDGVYLTSLKQVNTTITLNGMAPSNSKVADFMHSIEKSSFFSTPTLIQTQLVTGNGPRLIAFSLSVKMYSSQFHNSTGVSQ